MAQTNSNQLCWGQTAMILRGMRPFSLGTLPFLFDQNHNESQWKRGAPFKPDGRIIQRCARGEKGNAEGLSGSSQLTGIIHMLLTDTHLKERREEKKRERENMLKNAFSAAVLTSQGSQSRNHKAADGANVWGGWHRKAELVHVKEAHYFQQFET